MGWDLNLGLHSGSPMPYHCVSLHVASSGTKVDIPFFFAHDHLGISQELGVWIGQIGNVCFIIVRAKWHMRRSHSGLLAQEICSAKRKQRKRKIQCISKEVTNKDKYH